MTKKLLIGFMMILALVSCQKSKDNDDNVVATAYDKVLYKSDLQGVLYEGISINDSLIRTKSFIDNWIRRQLLIHQAENNLNDSDLDFSRQVEDYRTSLIIYKYESLFIEQNLDTVVSDEEISEFMENNSTIGMGKEEIRFILLNMRKKDLLEKLNNSLYNKAVKERVFVNY